LSLVPGGVSASWISWYDGRLHVSTSRGERRSVPWSAQVAGTVVGLLLFTPLTWLFYTAFLFGAALTFHFMALALANASRWSPVGVPAPEARGGDLRVALAALPSAAAAQGA
jgi:hypothetical protein